MVDLCTYFDVFFFRVQNVFVLTEACRCVNYEQIESFNSQVILRVGR